MTSTDVPLAPLPTLEERHLTPRVFESAEFGKLEAFVPTHSDYHCQDPVAPALVLIPGLGMDAIGFLRQLSLAPYAHIHLFQTPNNPVTSEPGMMGFGRYVEEYILSHKLDQHPGGVVLGGCSMGGAISLAVALRGRVKLRGLVLIGTFGSCQHLAKWKRVCAPLAWLIPMRAGRRVFWYVVSRSKLFGNIQPAEADWLISCKLPRTQRYFAAAVKALTTQEQIAAARSLNIPTLVLHGTDDRVLPYVAGQELAQNIPGAQLVTLEDAGHALFFTHHQRTNAAIAAFLKTLAAV